MPSKSDDEGEVRPFYDISRFSRERIAGHICVGVTLGHIAGIMDAKYSEPFGIAPLEAMSYDRPVIVSKQSGVSDVRGRS